MGFAATMDITALDITNEADVDQWFELFAEQQRVDFPIDPRPSRRALVGGLDHPWPGQRREHWVIREAGEVVASSEVSLPDLDNRESLIVEAAVGVQHRRRGYGRALVEHGVARATAEHRIRIITEVREPLPGGTEDWAGADFAEAMGFKRALMEVRRRLDLEAIPPSLLPDLQRAADSASAGYRLVRWGDDTPEDLLAEVAQLEGRMSVDPPLGDLHWEPEVYDADRIRGAEAAARARGRHVYNTGVVHEASGALVGYTMYMVDDDVREHAWQNATIVLPEHRGHRLGLRLKLANLDWVRAVEPALRTVDTWNAESNTHMIAVNELMGFVPIELGGEWQLDL